MGPLIVDGDSVPLGTRSGIVEEQTWAHLLGKKRGVEVINISTLEGTVAVSLGKLSQILDHRPSWYIAQFGQWCLFRRGGPDKDCVEPSRRFERNCRLLIDALQRYHVSICFVTPPPQLYHPGFAKDVRDYLRVIRELTYEYKLPLLDAHSYMAEEAIYTPIKEEIGTWFDGAATDLVHYSAKGHQMVAGYFDLPENKHIGALK